ncbi:Uncharacterised protein [Shewanella morhuae]|uniref:Uncharacterized protein n=1 Tax=Shewanella morhuae TaxID=365591 RepID=A0A380BW30_9GAMM|nr:Uncharacterised protein [Shewanella morhuae]
MNNRKSLSSQAAYLRRRKQKILKKLKQIHDTKRADAKFSQTSRLLSRTDSEMSQLMNSVN